MTRVSLLCMLLMALLGFSGAVQEEDMDSLPGAKRLTLTSGVGPESLAFDGSGNGPYTGISDGRIVKWEGEGLGWQAFAVPPGKREEVCDGNQNILLETVCGRPLGLQFYKATGELYVADAYNGLLGVAPEGGVGTLLAAEAEGEPFHFTNGLDIDQETGMVYFTDSSTHFTRRDFVLTVISGDTTRRLLRYNPSNKELIVLRKGLAFPNGVAMSHDNKFLLVAETTTCRILRYWLRGPKVETFDIFAEFPGYPDNVKKNSKGEFWVALNMEKVHLPSVSSVHSRWPSEHLVALRLSQDGSVLEEMDGKIFTSISEVEERGGTLWVGSVTLPYVGVYKKLII